MKCVDVSKYECSPRPNSLLIPHVTTFEDGSTLVICRAKSETDPEYCSLTGEVCRYVRGNVERLLVAQKLLASCESLQEILDTVERIILEKALERSTDRGEAAKKLGISPVTLYRKRKKFGL